MKMNITSKKMTAQKMTPKQMMMAKTANPKDKITGADFKALKKKTKKK